MAFWISLCLVVVYFSRNPGYLDGDFLKFFSWCSLREKNNKFESIFISICYIMLMESKVVEKTRIFVRFMC